MPSSKRTKKPKPQKRVRVKAPVEVENFCPECANYKFRKEQGVVAHVCTAVPPRPVYVGAGRTSNLFADAPHKVANMGCFVPKGTRVVLHGDDLQLLACALESDAISWSKISVEQRVVLKRIVSAAIVADMEEG